MSKKSKKDEIVQTKLECWTNKNLFSDYFLKNKLPKIEEEWEKEEIKETFKEVKKIYNREKDSLEKYNENQLEEHFIKPIFKVLGHHYEVQEKTYKTRKQPDYGFFPDDETRRRAHENKGEISFYKKAVGVGDAKVWGKHLNEKLSSGGAFKDDNPTRQIDTYLRLTAPEWGILTNGRNWRVYCQETSYKMDSYFDVDLIDIINKNDLESFKYFYFFFRLEAFLPDENGKNFLDRVKEESLNYAAELGEDLQENVYNALKTLAKGFLDLEENRLKKDPETIKKIHDNSLVFLYRILFILYAESRGLLDLSNDVYAEDFSLNSIKHEIAEKKDSGKTFVEYRKNYWDRLQELFSLINKGSESKGISKEDLFIPTYNGKLFNKSKNKFLEKNKVGDKYIADVIDLLCRSNSGFIDYSTLDIRDLGSIYEGLLEFNLEVAKEDIVSIKKGKKEVREVWIPKEDHKEEEILEEVQEGEIYLLTDKGERKATGSYYTPDYIVKYIVENTLEPIVKRKRKEARKNNQSERDAILSINILDPAMGSGHFLVEVVDFLTEPFLDAVSNDIENGIISGNDHDYDPESAKREIVSHCVYGVDLNPLAVELAKLSLWLKTIAKDKPLSFLDHRLRVGNSLIGSNLKYLSWHPEKMKKEDIDDFQERLDIPGFTKKLVDKVKEISQIKDSSLGNIRQKEEIFDDFRNSQEYDMIKTLADLRTSVYFGNKVDEKTYGSYSGDAFYSSEKEWRKRRNKDFAQEGREKAKNKKFFHWELEFPEVFFEKGKRKENSGFDVVLGNPPWGAEVENEDYTKLKFPKTKKANDTASYFLELSSNLSSSGIYGMIIKNSIVFIDPWQEVRELICSDGITKVLNPGIAFEDANIESTVIITNKKEAKEKYMIDIAKPLKKFESNKEIENAGSCSIDLVKNLGTLVDSPLTEKENKVLEKISEGGERLRNLLEDVKRGKDINKRGNSSICYIRQGPQTKRYLTKYCKTVPENILQEEKIQRILRPKLFAKPLRGWNLAFCIDKKGDILTGSNYVNILLPEENKDISLETLLGLLNSKLISFYVATGIYSKNTETARHLDQAYIGRVPIPITDLEEVVKKDKVELNFEETVEKINSNNNLSYNYISLLAERITELKTQEKELRESFYTDLEGIVKRDKFKDLKKGKQDRSLYKHEVFQSYVEKGSYTTRHLHEALKWDKNAFKEFVKILTNRISNLSEITSLYEDYNKKISNLNEKIRKFDNTIDTIVFDLYDLTEDEVETVLDSLETPEKEKKDIMEKFRSLN